MEVVRDLTAPASGSRRSVVTVGAYDGVHRGHQAVIGEVRRIAAERGLDTAVVTFDRHPATVVRPQSAPCLLTDLEQRLELLAETGVDRTLVVTFDEARSKESAEDFVRDVLVGAARAEVVVVGEDFHFGHQRRGNVSLLRDLGPGLGFETTGLGLVGADGAVASDDDRVSSTAIRSALAAGDLDTASWMLGRHHEVRGVVVEGDLRGGRQLGFPTANIDVPHEIQMPADGVYAGWYERPDGHVLQAAINFGRRPQFYADQARSLLEAHLLDFTGDLYGERARVRFVARLRDEAKFESIEALIAQIERDCREARRLLSA
jgi:riboflavin kinase/FMN adenylyltransferase